MTVKEKLRGFSGTKKIIIAASAVILAAAVALITVSAVRNKAERDRIEGYLSRKLETYGDMNIVSDAAEVDGKLNTVAGIKEAHRLGADTVTLDLCFNADNVPVICADYDDITKDTLKLEDVYRLLGEEKYSTLRINLRLRQLGSLGKFNELLDRYGLSGRVIISGIDKNRYSLISGDSTAAGIFFDYVPQKDAKASLNEIIAIQKEYGISGVIIDSRNITEELTEKLNQRGIVFIVGNTDDELSMFSALGAGACNIETSSPETLLGVFDRWKEQTRENMDKSILDELNKQ